METIKTNFVTSILMAERYNKGRFNSIDKKEAKEESLLTGDLGFEYREKYGIAPFLGTLDRMFETAIIEDDPVQARAIWDYLVLFADPVQEEYEDELAEIDSMESDMAFEPDPESELSNEEQYNQAIEEIQERMTRSKEIAKEDAQKMGVRF